MMKSALVLMILVTSVLGAASARAAGMDEMIEISDAAGGTEATLVNALGEELVATPVVIERRADGTVVLQRFEDNADVQDAKDKDKDPIGAVFSTSVRLSNPQLLSVSVGVVIGRRYQGSSDLSTGATGVLLQVEPGVYGGKASLGFAQVWGPGELYGIPLAVGGTDIKASFLRTWLVNDPANYAGLEADLSFFLVKVSAGLFRKVAGAESARRWVFSFGAGLGF